MADYGDSFLILDDSTHTMNSNLTFAESMDAANNIKDLMHTLTMKTTESYILVGGSSLILHGSTRTTNDIDLLIRKDTTYKFTTVKKPSSTAKRPSTSSKLTF